MTATVLREELTLERRADGRLWATRDGESRPVRVVRLFPWSAPDGLVSLRDEDDDEFALIGAGEPGGALASALLDAGFVFEVTAVEELDEEVEIRTWRVQTRQGERRFQTRLDDWPLELPGGGLLIRDVAGDLYRLENPGKMDRKSRELLWAFVD